jgi:hypothetical protein
VIWSYAAPAAITVVARAWGPVALTVVIVAFPLVYLGVILPAVWSRKPARRAAAAAVLAQLLGVLRRSRHDRDAPAARGDTGAIQ